MRLCIIPDAYKHMYDNKVIEYLETTLIPDERADIIEDINNYQDDNGSIMNMNLLYIFLKGIERWECSSFVDLFMWDQNLDDTGCCLCDNYTNYYTWYTSPCDINQTYMYTYDLEYYDLCKDYNKGKICVECLIYRPENVLQKILDNCNAWLDYPSKCRTLGCESMIGDIRDPEKFPNCVTGYFDVSLYSTQPGFCKECFTKKFWNDFELDEWTEFVKAYQNNWCKNVKAIRVSSVAADNI